MIFAFGGGFDCCVCSAFVNYFNFAEIWSDFYLYCASGSSF